MTSYACAGCATCSLTCSDCEGRKSEGGTSLHQISLGEFDDAAAEEVDVDASEKAVGGLAWGENRLCEVVRGTEERNGTVQQRVLYRPRDPCACALWPFVLLERQRTRCGHCLLSVRL
jgi:hypothetical protein